MKEEWKDIKGYEGRYQISNTGRVKSLARYVRSICEYKHIELILKPIKQKYDDYHYVNLRGKHYKIHRLVAETFIPNPQNKREVNHINGDKSNNRVENLEWATPKENTNHAIRCLKIKRGYEKQQKSVCQYDLNGVLLNQYINITHAARLNNLHATSICACCKGRAKTHGGFIWKYAETINNK